MEEMESFGDERQTAACAYCGGPWDTDDHVPSRVLLDEPYPPHLPVVGACQACNSSFSLDEEYVACLIECARVGSAEPSDRQRPKIRRILERRPKITARIAQCRSEHEGQIVFMPEGGRVQAVVKKLAIGHALFELNERRHDEPASIIWKPLPALAPDELGAFEKPLGIHDIGVWPEVGSRAMQRLALGETWVTVQEGRYRYRAMASGNAVVRIVMSEYLYCEVVWN